MGRPELGKKYACTGCHAPFYDLNRSPAVCPKCGVEQPTEQPRALRQIPPLRARRFIERPQPSPIAEDEVETLTPAEEADDEPAEPDDDDEAVEIEVPHEIEL